MASAVSPCIRGPPPEGWASFSIASLQWRHAIFYFEYSPLTCILISIVALLVFELWDSLRLVARKVRDLDSCPPRNWNPSTDDYGALPFIYGTLVTSALGLLLAVLFGAGAAIFLLSSRLLKLSDGMTFLIELLAAVPSVIFGLIGIFVLIPALLTIVPPIKDRAFGDHPPFFLPGPYLWSQYS